MQTPFFGNFRCCCMVSFWKEEVENWAGFLSSVCLARIREPKRAAGKKKGTLRCATGKDTPTSRVSALRLLAKRHNQAG